MTWLLQVNRGKYRIRNSQLKTKFIDRIPLQETQGKYRKTLISPSGRRGRWFGPSHPEFKQFKYNSVSNQQSGSNPSVRPSQSLSIPSVHLGPFSFECVGTHTRRCTLDRHYSRQCHHKLYLHRSRLLHPLYKKVLNLQVFHNPADSYILVHLSHKYCLHRMEQVRSLLFGCNSRSIFRLFNMRNLFAHLCPCFSFTPVGATILVSGTWKAEEKA